MKILSRNELKNVMGGLAPGSVTCNFVYLGGGGDTVNCGGDDLDSCQNSADVACEADDACTDASCKYA